MLCRINSVNIAKSKKIHKKIIDAINEINKEEGAQDGGLKGLVRKV